MTDRDKIIRMAREAEFHPMAGGIVEGNLLRFAALVAAAEREECAKVCEEKPKETLSEYCQVWGNFFARAIRARGNV